MPPVVRRSLNNLLDAVDVRGEGCNDDLSRSFTEYSIEDRADFTFGSDEAGNLSVRGVNHEQVHALFTEASKGTKVGQAGVKRKLVHLEITGDQQFSCRGADKDSQSVGNRVGHGDEFKIEVTDSDSVTFCYDVQVVGGQLVLTKLRFDECQCQFRTIDWDVFAEFQQVRNTADMVFVTVGEDHADNVVHAVFNPREVRENQVNTRLGFFREKNATVDNEEFGVELQHVHVAAHFTQATKWDDANGALF